MRIKAVTNGNIIDAHPDAAKQLIEAGIYEAVDEDPKERAPVEAKPTKKRKAR